MKTPNERRAEWASAALRVFANETGLSIRKERELVVQDMLCDMRHYCDRHALSFENLFLRALDHYTVEIVEDGPRLKPKI